MFPMNDEFHWYFYSNCFLCSVDDVTVGHPTPKYGSQVVMAPVASQIKVFAKSLFRTLQFMEVLKLLTLTFRPIDDTEHLQLTCMKALDPNRSESADIERGQMNKMNYWHDVISYCQDLINIFTFLTDHNL